MRCLHLRASSSLILQEMALEGKKFTCIMKGRRLKLAQGKVAELSKFFLDESNRLALEDFDGDAALLLDAVQLYRVCSGDVKMKFAFLGQIPYLFANITDRSVCALAVAQLAESWEDQRHRVSRQVVGQSHSHTQA